MTETASLQPPPPNSELYFGLVGAVGTNLKKVEDELTHELMKVGYEVKVIKLSELAWDIVQKLPKTENLRPESGEGEDRRLNRLMDIGNRFREELNAGHAMALPAVAQIRNVRQNEINKESSARIAFIIHSLKHQSEINTLKGIYRDRFMTISTYSPYEKRVENLKRKICQSRQSYDLAEAEEQARKLVERDKAETGKPLGQNVRECFPLADFFVDQTDEGSTVGQIRRFVEMLFGHQFHTPSMAEMGMFFARAAALRSSDLSRQVGAVIMGESGEVLATGCNEVPAAGGDAYWPGSSPRKDNRDFAKGFDQTSRVKVEMLSEIFSRLRAKGMLANISNADDEQLATDALAGTGAILKGTRAASIIEFGRAVHAEMSAITQAARRGQAVNGRTMFTTTFPCHMCARHIIASGILEVCYIEPYPKSMTEELYPDDVAIDCPPETGPVDPRVVKVRFVPFMGIAPNRFIEFFRSDERKDQFGWAKVWEAEKAQLRIRSFPVDTRAEIVALDELTRFATG